MNKKYLNQLLKGCALLGLTFWTGVWAGGDEICLLSPDSGSGNCPGQKTNGTPSSKFHYSTDIMRCIQFPHSGCGGNQNNFATLQECNAKCGHLASKQFREIGQKIKELSAVKKCLYNNKVFEEDATVSPCNNCLCTEDGSLRCPADGGCGGYGGSSEEKDKKTKPPCVDIQKAGKCCSECILKTEVDKMFKCKYDGAEFVEEQVFYPKNFPCLHCTCTKNFTGTLSMADCQTQECHFLSGNKFNKLMLDGCEPVYEKLEDCCPAYYDQVPWKCPNSKPKK